MGDWEQNFAISCPNGGDVTVGISMADIPVGGQVRFRIPEGPGVPAPVDSGWIEITNSTEVVALREHWGAGVQTQMSVSYRPSPNAWLAPLIATTAGELRAEELEVARTLENWTKWDLPLTGPAAGDVVVGVNCHAVGVGSQLRFTTTAGAVPAIDTGVRTIQTPNDSIGISQSWPAAYSTTMEVTFTAAGGLPDPSSSLTPYLAQVVHDGPYTRLHVIWSQVIQLVH
jgi:hypothetical protein